MEQCWLISMMLHSLSERISSYVSQNGWCRNLLHLPFSFHISQIEKKKKCKWYTHYFLPVFECQPKWLTWNFPTPNIQILLLTKASFYEDCCVTRLWVALKPYSLCFHRVRWNWWRRWTSGNRRHTSCVTSKTPIILGPQISFPSSMMDMIETVDVEC